VSAREAVAAARVMVVKAGSSSLTSLGGGLDATRLEVLVDTLARRRAAGTQLVLVSSGAIAAGLAPLGLARRPRDLATQQAAASVGQLALAQAYAASFARHGLTVGQVLLTADDVLRRAHYRNAQRTLTRLLGLGVVGASMFIGDSMITPAISVLSAVEGLKLAAPALEHYVVPLTVFILVVLFSVQSSGTARVASAFGPVMIVWFATLAVMGLVHISDDPSVLAAINPWYGINFLLTHGTIGLVTLGAVFLAVTGGEALYADLGHFGRKPIQAGWLYFVLPALLINYFGQGALVLSDPAAIENSFYRMVPEILLLPLVVLATAFFILGVEGARACCARRPDVALTRTGRDISAIASGSPNSAASDPAANSTGTPARCRACTSCSAW